MIYYYKSKMQGMMWSKGMLVPHDNLPIGMCGCNDYWKRNSKGELTGGWCDCRRRSSVALLKSSRLTHTVNGYRTDKPNGL